MQPCPAVSISNSCAPLRRPTLLRACACKASVTLRRQLGLGRGMGAGMCEGFKDADILKLTDDACRSAIAAKA